MSAKTIVPFLDLRAQHDPIRAELLAAFNEVIDQNAFAGGSFVQKFEEDFSAFCRAKHAIGVANGTDALWFALLALGVGPGDEVITVSATFMATAEAISYCGAKPVFVDIDEATATMNPALLERAITPKTKAIVPVHLYGQIADMDPILEIAKRHGIPVVEDACQAQGAEYKGRRAGTMGDLGCFSFYPGKNLGALGEAGGVITQDAALAAKVRTLREHGQEKRYYHSMIGWNGRMDGLQAAALRIKLRSLDKGNAARRANAALYSRLLADVPGVITPTVASYGVPVFHLYVIRVKNRDGVLAKLSERGIGCAIHYPKPVHLQQAYAHLGLGPGTTPVAERCADEILSLPMFPELTAAQVETVVTAVKQVMLEQNAARATAA